ncbi:MAG: hypothetical protein OHK93_002908 [Ramalina farinacea]|uniref:Mitochondrial import inner membrane translocase subunit TIM50 n=1 Tax=Ramalina farinacea TaxID=258253 RepID=A0AA43QSA4_9LECA|nr:hypothetical protein [Ramalina farinacea]
MDKQETLGLETLGIGSPRRKRDYMERRLKRAKGRRGEDPDLAPDDMPRNQPSEAFQQSQGRIPAWVDSVPSYTPMKIEPLGTYLTRASTPPTRLPNPQCLLLVLDLNGTLLHRKRATTSYTPRPFLDRFITYALSHHKILIWSSAQQHNVSSICSRIFTPDQRSRLLGVWARDTLGLSAAQYGEKVQVYKQLQKVWADQDVQAAHPTGGKWDQGNTILIDDSKEKARAEPWNLVEVPEFLGPGRSEGEEDVLGQVERWVEEAKGWSDVSGFVKAMGGGFRHWGEVEGGEGGGTAKDGIAGYG